MSLPDLFKQHIESKQFFQANDELIVACSGGIDSVVLVHLLSVTNKRFQLAHMNFRLRGAESDRDRQFVEALGAKYQVPVHIKSVDTASYASEHSISIQVAARELRYSWFREMITASSNPRSFVLTAHQADDSIETVCMNFFRGTGLRGLTGIPEINEGIIRPLLPFSREQLHQYALSIGLPWVEDSSNSETKYTRNRIRHEVLPVLEQLYPGFRQNILQNMERLSESAQLAESAVSRIRKRLLVEEANEWRIPVAALLNASPLHTIVYECFHPFGFGPSQVEEILQLSKASSGRYIDSTTHRVMRHQKWLLIYPLNEIHTPRVVTIDAATKQVTIDKGVIDLSISTDTRHINKSRDVAQFDAAKIQFPLIVRPWKQGDYFYPFGMEKKKKIARFLIDQKLSMPDKEKVLVVEMDSKIIWVVGHRIDNRFRITENTKEVLVMKKG